MLLRVRLIGSGKEGDPYRANLPTYQHVHGNISERWAIVILPDTIHPLSNDDLAAEESQDTTEGPLYPKLSDGALAKIHKHFDARYPKSSGTFRIEHV